MPRGFPEEKRKEWKENILKQRASGLSIASWCRNNNIEPLAFYYWRNKFFPKTSPSRSDFTEIVQGKEQPSKGIILEYRGFNIHLSKHFDPYLLKDCLEVLKKC